MCSYQQLGTNSIINTTVQTCNISSGNSAGGFITDALNYNNYIKNSTVQNTNITGTGNYNDFKQIGAMIGQMWSYNYLNFCFENSSVISNNISGICGTAGIVGTVVGPRNAFLNQEEE
ncbi:Hypothetical_protein [Hexamita inflata]|uniref:Hypothetical_protein n=1 Tax=Hexamita inflata TaxID=28002 RepID=A0AA86QNT4_9EUKA|nr:Hypothetical protein HINF_LOCUS47727 [Hexamita inflata]